MAKVEALARDVPNFQLAQLVHGDLLLTRRGKLDTVAAPAELPASAAAQWGQLRQEAALRLAALSERPPHDALPRQFVDIPQSTRHVIAVDASRARLYLFENGAHGMKLVSDHYVSLGKLGVDKQEQGDQRTPLGVYFITSRLDSQQLQDFYGTGALTLNYPNEYDRRRGKTGSGIWLHGVPSQNFARTPQSTEGCVWATDLTRLCARGRQRARRGLASRLDWVPQAQAGKTGVAHGRWSNNGQAPRAEMSTSSWVLFAQVSSAPSTGPWEPSCRKTCAPSRPCLS